VLVYKTKSHSKQQTGVNCLTNFEMPDLIFSLTSQCHKTIILHIVFKKEKKLSGLLSSNNQSMQVLLD